MTLRLRFGAAVPLICLLLSSANGQINPGDIGVTWISSSQFSILRANGSSTVFNTGGFLGAGSSSTLTLSPIEPNTYWIGGSGFIGRAQITGPSTVNYSLISNGVPLPAQFAWDGSSLIVFDSGTDQIVQVNINSGSVTNLTSGTQPWGIDLNAGYLDPSSGRMFAGGNNGIWVIEPGSTTPLPYASGWVTPAQSSYVTGIAIDRESGEPVATILAVNRVVRIDQNGVLTNLVPQGSIPGPNSIEVDDAGDFIVGASFGQIYRVPRAGGSPQPLGTASGVIGAATGASPLRSSFQVYLTPQGQGAALLAMNRVPSTALEGFTFASLDVALPVGQGGALGLVPDALTLFLFNSFPVPAPGSFPHWTYPTGALLFPDVPVTFAPGFFPNGLVIDVLGVAVSPSLGLIPTAVRRVRFN